MTERWFARATSIVWRATSTEIVVLPGKGQDVVRLSGSGVALWEALEESRSSTDLAELLALRFGVPAAQVSRDLQPVLDDLHHRGVLVASAEHEVEQTA